MGAAKKISTIEEYEKRMRQEGFNPSLPFAVVNREGRLVFMNARMAQLLNQRLESAIRWDRFELESNWPFINDHLGGPAVLRSLLREEGKTGPIKVHANMKNFCLYGGLVSKKKGTRLIVAELLRHGDILKDKTSRQVLYRSVSHEIRTSVLAMRGYLEMIDVADEDQRFLIEKCQTVLKRFDQVVHLLEDLKTELEVEVDPDDG